MTPLTLPDWVFPHLGQLDEQITTSLSFVSDDSHVRIQRGLTPPMPLPAGLEIIEQ